MIQMNVKAGDVPANRANGLSLARQAAACADVLVLPEIWTTGYHLKELGQWAENEDSSTLKALKEIARENKKWIIAGSLPVRRENGIFNSMYVLGPDGLVAAEYDKIHMFSMYGEAKYFLPGTRRSVCSLNGTVAGLAICYDLRFPELFRSLTADGAQIIVVVAEWPAARRDHWRLLCQTRAIENQVYIVAVNCVGEHKGIVFHGHSLLVSPDGVILAEGDDTEQILCADIDLLEINKVRQRLPVWQDRKPEAYASSPDKRV